MKKKYITIFIIIILNLHCEPIDRLTNEFTNFRREFIDEIDQTNYIISNGIGSISQALEDLNSRLDATIQKTLIYNVPFIIKTLGAEATIVGLCYTDFAASRALYFLSALKAEFITGVLPAPPCPTICSQTLPNNVIDLNAPVSVRETILFTGFDIMNLKSCNIRAQLIKSNDIVEFISEDDIKIQSDYQFTIKLPNDSVLKIYKSFQIIIDSLPMFSVSIIPKVVIIPKPEDTNAVFMTISSINFLVEKKGETIEFNGGPDVIIKINLTHDGEKVYANFTMTAKPSPRYYPWTIIKPSDYPVAEFKSTYKKFPVYTIKPGYKIMDFSPKVQETFYGSSGLQEEIPIGNTIVKVTYRGDRKGKDVPDYTAITRISFPTPFKLKIIKE